MALSDERILELAGLATNRRVCASTCMTRKIDKKPCQCYPGMRNDEALALARVIEAEARLDALEEAAKVIDGVGMFHEVAAGSDLAFELAAAIRKLKEDIQ